MCAAYGEPSLPTVAEAASAVETRAGRGEMGRIWNECLSWLGTGIFEEDAIAGVVQ